MNTALILQRLQQITTWINSVIANSKKIDELPVKSEASDNLKIQVSDEGISKQLLLNLVNGNNIPILQNYGIIPGTGEITNTQVSEFFNTQPWSLSIGSMNTPVFFEFRRIVNDVNRRYLFLFNRGKGLWGKANGAVTDPAKWVYPANFHFFISSPVTPADVEMDPNSVIHHLENVVDGDYIAAANLATWDFSDSGQTNPDGTKSYYFSFTHDNGDGNGNVLYYARFKGPAGIYGDEGITLLPEHFDDSYTSSLVVPGIPNINDVLGAGNNSDKKLILTDIFGSLIQYGGRNISYKKGSSTTIGFEDPEVNTMITVPAKQADDVFAMISDVNGMTITANQASSEIYLKNAEGVTLATLNVGFLNNEGTTFFYNEATEMLELRDDAGNILSSIPVSAFVSNLMQSVNFNGATPYVLEFKDAEGNVVDSVTLGISNIQSLQAVLDGKFDNPTGNTAQYLRGDGTLANLQDEIPGNTSQLINDGEDGTSRYTQDSEIYHPSAINLLDISQVDYTERYSPGGNNIVSRSGTAFVRTDWIPVEEGKTYTLNKSFPYADNTIGLFTAYGTTTSVAKITANTSGNISFTIPEGLGITHIIINLTTTVVNGDILSSTEYMLNEGFRSIPYISFGSHSYIKDELLVPVDYSKIDDNDLFELRSTNLIDVRRVVNTERYSPGGNNIVSRGITRFVRTDWIPVEEGKWYIINKNLNGRGGYFSTYGNTTAVSSIDLISTSQGTSYMFYVPTGQNIKYVVLNLSTTTTTGNTLLYDDYQLEKGSVSTPYKEYLLKPQIKSTYLKDPYNESNLRKYITFDNINYSGTSSKIVKFKEHWIKKDKDLVVVTTGTSLTGRNTEHCTEHAFASLRPPLMNSNNFATHIWDALVWEGQQYRRYDSGGFFTETGTWITSGGIADWDDNGYRTALTRYSTGAAFIGFGIPSGAWQFNFIYRTDFNATENATITIIEGNGLVEVFNGTTWVEANGYVFSQRESAITEVPSVSYTNPITGATDILTDYQTKGNTTYQKRLKMRCKNHSGLDSRSVGKTVTITNTTGRLTYWGVEWSPREFMIAYINAARGSHNGTVDSSLSLLHYQDNDIWGFDPDLLLIENPIHNSGGNGIPDPSYPTTYWGQTTDGFFFEASGVSLKSRAEDLGVFVSDLEWIVYNSSIAYNFGGIDTAGSLIPSTNIDGKVLTALDAQQLSHQWMVDNHAEVMSFNLVKNWVDAALDVYGNLRTSTVGSGKAGLTFTNEGSHWNDTGCKVQARLIVPVFDFNLDNF